MVQQAEQPPASAPLGGSERVRLARLARAAALRMPGVASVDAGPTGLFFTAGGGERLDGVTCVAASGGGYDVSLRLRCELVPLHELADAVKTAVSHDASLAGIALADVSVLITDVVEPERP
jgi:hypothetical protein